MKTNELQIFNYENNQVRTVMKDDEIWWVLKDVCEVLGLSTPARVAERLDEDEKGMSQTHTPGGIQKLTIINESGLYSTILRSDKPEAKKFKRWVTHEVLPSIRKHGAYMTPEKAYEIMNDPDVMITLLNKLKTDKEKIKKLEHQIHDDKPKVLFADSIAASDDTILIGELAKILKGNGVNIGQNRLFEKLRQEGFLMSRNGCDHNMPTQKSMDLKLFKIKETAITHSDGHVTISKTTKVTGKGQLYFVNYFINESKEAKRKMQQRFDEDFEILMTGSLKTKA